MTHMTHFTPTLRMRARAHAHAKVTENSVMTCHVSGPCDYATCDADESTKPVYRPGDDLLEFKRSVRHAALDVMILTFAARRHAEWLRRLGVCPPDVADSITKDLASIGKLIAPPPTQPHVGTCPPNAATGERLTPTPRNATRRNVGRKAAKTEPLFNTYSHSSRQKPQEGE